jgi:hypothetical protein
MSEVHGLEWIIDAVKSLIASRFTGELRINFFKGGVTNINFSGTAIKGQKILVSVT